MKLTRARIVQLISLTLVQAIVLMLLAFKTPNVTITYFWAAIAVVILVSVVESLVWWVFIEFFAHLPIFLYPLLTFLLTGFGIAFAGNHIPGVEINGLIPAIWISISLTVVNAILSGLFSLDEDASFDRNVTRKMVGKYGKPANTDKPGILYLEIDGLSIDVLKTALEKGHMPTLKNWLDSGSHKLISWETDFTSQTGAMQTGILLGNNTDIPAYRWWDRKSGKMIMSGNPKDAKEIEKKLSNGKGLLSNGGASRGNMFSGDASESLFTMSSMLVKSRGRGPGFYFYLINPYVVARLISRFFIEVVKEWYEAWQQKRQYKKGSKEVRHIVSSRNIGYAFLRAFMGPFLQDLTTFAVISDIMRGVPAVYALYAGYDDLGHFAGMKSKEAFEALHETDRYFTRVQKALEFAPRPYHIVILSDHGQSEGPTFEKANGTKLDSLVKNLVGGEVYATIDTNEAWDNLNAVLSESTRGDTKSAHFAKKALLKKTDDGVVQMGPDRDKKLQDEDAQKALAANVVIFGSGSAGLIYFKDSKVRMSYEAIQKRYPNLIPGLLSQKGIGLVIVKSEKQKTLAIAKDGINFVDIGKVTGKDPLKDLGQNASLHIKRESSFENCPDIIVTTKYDPKTEELAGFENQVSHHGGLGGAQNRPFIMFPSGLKYDGKPVIWAINVYKLLYSWRVD